nr:MAG TPA: hypothetical protein [Caudoviricetes sp.]
MAVEQTGRAELNRYLSSSFASLFRSILRGAGNRGESRFQTLSPPDR